MSTQNKYQLLAVLLAILCVTVGLKAQGFLGDQRLCPADRPCIIELYQSGSTLIIGWDGHENFDHYNVRWSRPGKAETQQQVKGGNRGSFRINNVNPDTRYTVKVQGCNRPFLGRSKCTPWYEDWMDTRSKYHHGPDTCKDGFVWREAKPGDRVCVPPESRRRVAAENRTAALRHDPNGAYGPLSCKQGFVWREAFAGDEVCVTPKIRDLVREENRLAAGRRIGGK